MQEVKNTNWESLLAEVSLFWTKHNKCIAQGWSQQIVQKATNMNVGLLDNVNNEKNYSSISKDETLKRIIVIIL